MKYGSVSKTNFPSNASGNANLQNPLNKSYKPKDFNMKLKNTYLNSLITDKDLGKNIMSSFRPGVINGLTATKFKTSKNSRKFINLNILIYSCFYSI